MACKVVNCKNSVHKSRGDPSRIVFYSFPKDKARFQLWELAAGCDPCHPNGKNVICEEHFENSAFRLQDVLMNAPKKKLNDTALPTLNLPTTLNLPISQTRAVVAENEEETMRRKHLVQKLLHNHEKEKIQAKLDKARDMGTQTTIVNL